MVVRSMRGIDAPPPCSGICVWREVEWVDHYAYKRCRERVLSVLEAERRVRGVLFRLAWVRPREGEWERSWAALQAEAREAFRMSTAAGTPSSPAGGTG
ncbi:MAG TPA: hypothetical protein VGI50_01135 [Solirubrobacteraceae bacterium]